MRRIEEADEETRRGLVLKLLTGLKQICNHPAHFLKQANPRLLGPLGEARPARRAHRHGARRGRRGAGLHPVRRHGAAARAPPVPRRACRTSSCTAARRSPSGRRWWRASRPGETCRSSCCRSRPAAPASTSPRPTTSSTTTAGGTRPSRTRPPTGPTASARPGRCRCTGSSPRAPSRSGSPSCSRASARSPTRCSARGEAALTELSNDELRDLVELRGRARAAGGSAVTGAQTVTHPRIPPRRGGGAGTWWSKAWGRAVEESAFAVAELHRGRALARAGEVGAIAVDTGRRPSRRSRTATTPGPSR